MDLEAQTELRTHPGGDSLTFSESHLMGSQRGLRLAATLGQSENLGKRSKLRDSQVLKKVQEKTAVEREDQPCVGVPAGHPVQRTLCVRPECALRTSVVT